MSLFKQIYDFLTCITSFFPTFTLPLLPFRLFLTFSKMTTMKKFLLLGLFMALNFVSFSQTTIFDEPCDTKPATWTYTGTITQQGGYWKAETNGASATSPAIDANGYDNLEVVVNLRSFGSGGAPSADVTVTCGALSTTSSFASIPNSYTDYTVTLPATYNNCANLVIKVERTNPTGRMLRISNVKLNGTAPAPISLKYFKSKESNNQVSLIWETATETNNEYFTIERSAEGSRFEAIGKVKGAGNSTTALRYEFVDNAPMRGTNYYRLTQTDYDGKSESFDVVSVDFKGAGTTTIRPTQVKDLMTLSLEPVESVGRVTIFNLVGQKVYSQVIEPGSSNMEIDASAFAQGQYVARVSTGNFVETVRFIKQ